MNRTEIEAAAFRQLVLHLQQRADVQDDELMALAGFSRDSLVRWYQAASAEQTTPVSRDEARAAVFGMTRASNP